MEAPLLSQLNEHKLTVERLKQELRARSAHVTGNKVELEDRLRKLLEGKTVLSYPERAVLLSALNAGLLSTLKLREELSRRGMDIRGTKPELEARLRTVLSGQAVPAASPLTPTSQLLADLDAGRLKVDQLKDELRVRGAKVSGTKLELEFRLRSVLTGAPVSPAHPVSPTFSVLPPVSPTLSPTNLPGEVKAGRLTVEKLKAELRARGLSTKGKKAELQQRLLSTLLGQAIPAVTLPLVTLPLVTLPPFSPRK